MDYILDDDGLEQLRRFSAPDSLLAFDYDGTLAPIVSDPTQARMPAHTRALLERLARKFPLAVVSGRGRSDVARLLDGVKVVEVVGNHGFEGGDALSDAYLRTVAGWRQTLEQELATLPGVSVEDKRYSLAVHFRHAPDPESARRRIAAVAETLAGARLIGGKAVVNVVPEDAPHKGDALLALQKRLGSPRVLYVGDDDTDEDVFRLKRSADFLCIRVGQSDRSAAEYFIADQAEIDRLIQVLLDFSMAA